MSVSVQYNSNLLGINIMGIVERKEREREARREQILSAAQTVFERGGLGQSSMDEIAKEAELAKGTIYLYYKNKDELIVGLILRGFEKLYELMIAECGTRDRGILKLQGVGDAYHRFAGENSFLFSVMNVSEPPPKSNISSDLLDELLHLSEKIWKFFYHTTEQAKDEGDIKQEVNGFTLVLTLWLSSTGILRMYNKCLLNSDNNVYGARRGGIHLQYLDWDYVYNITSRMLLENVVTEQGRTYLRPLEWRSFEEIGFAPVAEDLYRVLAKEPAAIETEVATEI
ncbi:MAG TPA: TetR/AcrR family transcriptional regulator [Candidatus Kapabacteria bacterium]|nr:TetR/AcrR family transcriptional regulator [Candidatus Kapabacteria bacterium]